eukprot:gb/GECG01011652.1/.p1 GENE.gb/GECG01011652.1/~~gb/GECG01011652.1/.p1  ORF type:complete len:1622 (+),score=187.47 gb/GECG01011652.1/:1-4866(+)
MPKRPRPEDRVEVAQYPPEVQKMISGARRKEAPIQAGTSQGWYWVHSLGFVAVYRYPASNRERGIVYICRTAHPQQAKELKILPNLLCVQELNSTKNDRSDADAVGIDNVEVAITAVVATPSIASGREYTACFWSSEDHDQNRVTQEGRWKSYFVGHCDSRVVNLFEGEAPTVLHPLNKLSSSHALSENTSWSTEVHTIICGSFGHMLHAVKVDDGELREVTVTGYFADAEERNKMSSSDGYGLRGSWSSRLTSWLGSSQRSRRGQDGSDDFQYFSAKPTGDDSTVEESSFRVRRGISIAEGGVIQMKQLEFVSNSSDIMILTPSKLILYRISSGFDMELRGDMSLPLRQDGASSRLPISFQILTVQPSLRVIVLWYDALERSYSLDVYSISTDSTFANDDSIRLASRVQLPHALEKEAILERIPDPERTFENELESIDLPAPSRLLGAMFDETEAVPVLSAEDDNSRTQALVLFPPTTLSYSGRSQVELSVIGTIQMGPTRYPASPTLDVIVLNPPSETKAFPRPTEYPHLAFAGTSSDSSLSTVFYDQYSVAIDLHSRFLDSPSPFPSTPRNAEEGTPLSFPFLRVLPEATVTALARIVREYVTENHSFDDVSTRQEASLSSDQIGRGLSVAIRSLFDEGVCRLTAFTEAGTHGSGIDLPEELTTQVQDALQPLCGQGQSSEENSSAIDSAIENVSNHIMDQKPQPRGSSRSDGEHPWDMLNSKAIKHILLVFLLKRLGFLQKASRATRRLLSDHGSRLASVISFTALHESASSQFEIGSLAKERLKLSEGQKSRIIGEEEWDRSATHCEGIVTLTGWIIGRLTKKITTNVHGIARAGLSPWHVVFSSMTKFQSLLQLISQFLQNPHRDELESKASDSDLQDVCIDCMLTCILSAQAHVARWHSFYELPPSDKPVSSVDLHSWIENDSKAGNDCLKGAESVCRTILATVREVAGLTRGNIEKARIEKFNFKLNCVMPLVTVGLTETRTERAIGPSWDLLVHLCCELLSNFDYLPLDSRPAATRILRQSISLALQPPGDERRRQFLLAIGSAMLPQGPAALSRTLSRTVAPKVNESLEVFGWFGNRKDSVPLLLQDINRTDDITMTLYCSPAAKQIGVEKGMLGCLPLANATCRLDIRSILSIVSCYRELRKVDNFRQDLYMFGPSLSGANFAGVFVEHLFRRAGEPLAPRTSRQASPMYSGYLSSLLVFASDVFSILCQAVKSESAFLQARNPWNEIFNKLVLQHRTDVVGVLLLRLASTKQLWYSEVASKQENQLMEQCRVKLCNISATAMCSISQYKEPTHSSNANKEKISKSCISAPSDGSEYASTTVCASLGKLAALITLKQGDSPRSRVGQYVEEVDSAKGILKRCNDEIWVFHNAAGLINDTHFVVGISNNEGHGISGGSHNTNYPVAAVRYCVELLEQSRKTPLDAGYCLGQAAQIVYQLAQLHRTRERFPDGSNNVDDSHYKRFNSLTARLADGDVSVFASEAETPSGIQSTVRSPLDQDMSSAHELFVLVVRASLVVDLDMLLLRVREMHDNGLSSTGEAPITFCKMFETLQTLLMADRRRPNVKVMLTDPTVLDDAAKQFGEVAISKGYSPAEIEELLPAVKSFITSSI